MTQSELAGPFSQKIWINIRQELVVEALTSCQGLTSFFLAQATCWDADGDEVDGLVEGGTYEFVWAPGMERDTGTIYRCDEEAVEYGWYQDEGVVSIFWEPMDNGTMVTLTQSMDEPIDDIGERAERQYNCAMGWLFYLVNLKSVLEGGLDLRETDGRRRDVVNL